MMNLSIETVNTLKNFSQINPSLVVKPGSELVTMSPSKTIIAKMITTEVFNQPFCIYELNKFLGVVSMLEEPDFDFGDKSVTIKSKTGTVNYTYADESMVVAPITNSIEVKNSVASFQLNKTELSSVIRAASVLQTDLVKVSSEDGQLKVGTANSKDATSHTFNVDIETDGGNDFDMFLKTENIVKILPDSYTVTVSSNVIEFRNDTHIYWIVAENTR